MKGVNRIYFETSSVNYLADLIFNNPNFGSLATKRLQIEKGRKWQISNVALWEIFLTKDEDRRYNLFDLSRCLFYDTLICSPEEIIINYINAGCPIVEKPYELNSKALFSREWITACKHLDFAFQPDRTQLEEVTAHLRFMGELFVKSSKGYSLANFQHLDEVSGKIDITYIKYIFDKISNLYNRPVNEIDKNYIAYILQVVMMILCYGLGFDQPTIQHFWNKTKKTEPLERLEIAVDNFPEIFFRGPLANITKMIILQANNKTGRGLYFDSLQAIYTTYCDLFVTNDDHFLKFRTENSTDPNMLKIISVKNLNLFNV